MFTEAMRTISGRVWTSIGIVLATVFGLGILAGFVLTLWLLGLLFGA